MKDVVLDELFEKRVIESNIFSEEEQKEIKENYLLYRKCYFLGILDKEISNKISFS